MLASRRALVVAALPVALSAAVLAGCSGGSAPADAAGSSGTPSTSPAGPTASGSTPSTGSSTPAATARPSIETAKPSVAVSPAAPVRIGRSTALRSGVIVTVGRPRTIRVAANGPGEIAGSALVVPVTVRNDTSAAIDLGGLVVNASYGSGAGTPASPSDASPARPLAGSLGPGRSSVGQYVFVAPATAASRMRVEVSSSDAARILVFRS